jgi:hypothetical protein
VQLLVLRASPEWGARGRRLWPAPARLPAQFSVTLDRRWAYDPARDAAALTSAVERRLCEVLSADPAS